MHYLIGSSLLLLIWVIIFTFKKEVRKEMLFVSLIITPAALTQLLFVPGYWLPDSIINPKLSLEDFIFSFSVGGLAAVLYEVVARKNIYHQRLSGYFQNRKKYPKILLTGVIATLLSYFILRINFMYATYIGIGVDIVLMTITRFDLFFKILASAFLFGFFYTLFFAVFSYFIPEFLSHWNFSALSGYFILNVPLEEIVWGFGIGGLIGPIYEYLLGLKIVEL